MARIIHKYPLPEEGENVVSLPWGAVALSVGTQPGNPHKIRLWVLINPEEKRMQDRKFFVMPTGKAAPQHFEKLIGRVDMLGGQLIFHVFEVTR